ncbi:heme/hemin ABC transporter substrate-binding protein [Nocardioides campestrisoli]|uniref:heme/hemin ABC transporter substrate-binding protein n=1 Tax=Nocardioides campestrisoli TaxID=2736757 RepID=UPI0015E7CBDE|nr:ABC transporter substrate-binding protein [Nocardioides campestrisoli]
MSRSLARPATGPVARLVAVAAAVALAGGCGIQGPDRAAGNDAASGAAVAPPISEVTPAEDPRAWRGPVSAGVAASDLDPVAEDPAPALPVTLTDAQGTEVVIEDVSRVLALDLHGTLARTVFELGLGDRLVGRDLSTQFDQAADLPLVTGSGHELNAEAILDLDPTLIITDTSLGPWDVVLQMRESGIPVVVVESSRSLGNLDELTRMVAGALGVPDAGEVLVERVADEVAQVRADIDEIAPADERQRLRTIFLYVRGNAGVYYMFGKGSGADDLIDAVGAYDVAEEIGWSGMRPVTAEGLVAAAPELVVMMTKGLESTGGVDGLLEKLPALANTPAGQNERFVDIADSLVLGYGPGTAEVLNALAVAVHAPQELG